MNGSEFLDKMGLIAPEFIEEAEIKSKRKNPWIKWLAAVACICIAVGFAVSAGISAPPEEPETSSPGEGPPNFTANGIPYYISSYMAVSEELPEGFEYAGETNVGGFENCPYYVSPEIPEWIYVYQEVTTDGTVDSTGTLNRTEPHYAYVRYVDIRLRGKDLVCVNGEYYISLWSAAIYGDYPDVTEEYYDSMENEYGIRIEGEHPEDFVLVGTTGFSGYDTVPKGALASNEGEFEVYINPDDRDVILVSTSWHTAPVGENGETFHKGFNIYIRYDCPFA